MNNQEYESIFKKYDGNIEKIIKETGYLKGTILARLKHIKLIPGRNLSKYTTPQPTKNKYFDFFCK